MDACGVAVDFAGDVITSFLCKLTRRGSGGSSKGTARYRPCDCPWDYRHLQRGRYVFRVRSRNSVGRDPTPARRSFGI
jgi:hypothetical protein